MSHHEAVRYHASISRPDAAMSKLDLSMKLAVGVHDLDGGAIVAAVAFDRMGCGRSVPYLHLTRRPPRPAVAQTAGFG